jgi:hypothetical protein
MKVFEGEKEIASLVANNKTKCDSTLVTDISVKTDSLNNVCKGNACAIASIAPNGYKPTDDVTTLSSILVSDIWNANDDVFTSEEILSRYSTAKFKPINWMHKGSEDTENENIGVMLETTLVEGDVPEVNIIKAEDASCSDPRVCSGKIHVKQDGIIWSGYFPTYAQKIKKGIQDGKLFVSMECFFEDFGYALRNSEDSEIIFLDRTDANSKMSKDLIAFGGKGTTQYKGQKYQIGRWLKKITFSGQGVVYEPANKKNNKIYSIIFAQTAQELMDANSPIPTVQEPGAILNPAEMMDDTSNVSRTDTPQDLKNKREMPTTYTAPSDGFMFFTAKEAESVGKIKLGCTGYHLYQENRHGDKPLLYSALIADPTDLEKQMAIPQYRPCEDERELRFVLKELGISQESETSYYIDKPEGSSQLAVDDDGNPVTPCGTQTFNPKFPACVVSYNSTTKQCTPTNAPSNQNNPNCAEFNQLAEGPETAMGNITKQLSETLIKNKNKVYKNKEEKMSQQNITENAQITELKEQLAYAEQAIVLATSHIGNMNFKLSRLDELESFKAQAEQIIEEAYDNKVAQDRLTEMREIVGESYTEEDLPELKAMSEASFAELRKAVSKVSSKIEKVITEQEIVAKASQAISQAKKQQAQTPNFVVATKHENKADVAKNLIAHALRRK